MLLKKDCLLKLTAVIILDVNNLLRALKIFSFDITINCSLFMLFDMYMKTVKISFSFLFFSVSCFLS